MSTVRPGLVGGLTRARGPRHNPKQARAAGTGSAWRRRERFRRLLRGVRPGMVENAQAHTQTHATHTHTHGRLGEEAARETAPASPKLTSPGVLGRPFLFATRSTTTTARPPPASNTHNASIPSACALPGTSSWPPLEKTGAT